MRMIYHVLLAFNGLSSLVWSGYLVFITPLDQVYIVVLGGVFASILSYLGISKTLFDKTIKKIVE